MRLPGSTLDRMKHLVTKPVPIPTHRPRWKHALVFVVEVVCTVAALVGLTMALSR